MRRDSSHLFPFISIFLLFSTLSFGQAWSNVLAPSRAINWSNAGLPATLPDGETTTNPWTPPIRTQCGSTVTPSGLTNGTDVTNINNAITACASGHYVMLASGTFYIENAGNCFGGGSVTCVALYSKSGVTLRGSGPMQTILSLAGNSTIQFGTASGVSGTWSGASQGATSVSVTVSSAPVVGQLAYFKECDTGFSGSGCGTGSSSDNGGLYICGDNTACAHAGTNSGPHQQQTVYITAVSGTNPYTVSFSPGLYMPNWSSSVSPIVSFNTAFYGNGLEDLTVYSATTNMQNVSVNLTNSYGSWIKGVRLLSAPVYGALYLTGSKNSLVINNYIFSDLVIDSNYPFAMQEAGTSDSLVLNNIMASGVPWEGLGGNEGNVKAYNYGRDTFTMYYENNFFEHDAGSAFHLYEGNQVGVMEDDVTHGTHTLNTWFRNYVSGWDPPYTSCSSGCTSRGIEWDAFARFENAVGNVIGGSLLTGYQAVQPTAPSGYVFPINTDTSQNDPLTLATSLRWGNCDTATETCRFLSSEVPTTLTGNAVPFENSVPSTHNLPCSFFLPGYASTTCTLLLNGGTGLSWWKVCTTWATFPTDCSVTQTQPFPIAGPDITGGPYVNGTAYDIPAAIAFKNLPIDATYQNSYSITGSSWSNGTETLTVSGLPNTTHLMGGFQISGGACAGGEFFMTTSTSTTVSYALASNPGGCSGGTMKFPDVRQFDERVYENDPNSDPPPAPPTGLNAQVD
jgi:hypothetical protein